MKLEIFQVSRRKAITQSAVLLLVSCLTATPFFAAESPAANREAFSRADSVAEIAREAKDLRVGDRLRVEGLAIDRETVGLDLERFEVFAPDGELVVHSDDGVERRPFGANAYFRGQVVGEPGSLAVLSVLPDGRVRGVVRRERGLWSLNREEPAPDGSQGLVARRAEEPAASRESFTCASNDLPGDMRGLVGKESVGSGGGPSDLGATTTPYTVRVAIETDWELFQNLGSVGAVTDYVGELIAFASAMYDSEINTNLIVSYLSTWSTSSDPWTQVSPLCSLFEFGRYWNDNRTGVDRTVTHFVSGKNNGGGVAWLGVLCDPAFNYNHGGACPGLSPYLDNYGGDYGYTGDVDGDFNPDNPLPVWDIIAVAHEIGHNFNSPHTHCYNGIGGSSQPVDQCYNGEAGNGCYSGVESLPGPAGAGSGTIMSYCHFRTGGFSNIAFSFGTGHAYGTLPQRVPDRMRAHVETQAATFPACFVREDPGGPTDPPCPDELFLSSGTVNGTDLEETCGVIYAGGSYTVGGSGDLTLRAFRVVLQDGFSVASGGSLTIDTQ